MEMETEKTLKNNPMFIYLAVLTICSTVGLQAWLTLFNNFAVEIAGLDGNHIGVIQSVREIPGFLALLVVYVIMVIKEHRLSALSVLIMGFGLAFTGLVPNYAGLILTTLVMSFGFHYYETTNMSLTLQYFEENASPWVFGKQRSYAAASSIALGLAIYILAFFMSFAQIYLLLGGLITAAAIWALYQKPAQRQVVPQRKKMIVRKKYWLFYFLTFMAGARRQIDDGDAVRAGVGGEQEAALGRHGDADGPRADGQPPSHLAARGVHLGHRARAALSDESGTACDHIVVTDCIEHSLPYE